jgi:hypothetical protein
MQGSATTTTKKNGHRKNRKVMGVRGNLCTTPLPVDRTARRGAGGVRGKGGGSLLQRQRQFCNFTPSIAFCVHIPRCANIMRPREYASAFHAIVLNYYNYQYQEEHCLYRASCFFFTFPPHPFCPYHPVHGVKRE